MKTGTNEERPSITVPTEGEYKGSPMLMIPTDNPKFPINMGVKKWRFIFNHMKAVEAFLAKHPAEESESEEELCAKLGITKEQLLALKGGK